MAFKKIPFGNWIAFAVLLISFYLLFQNKVEFTDDIYALFHLPLTLVIGMLFLSIVAYYMRIRRWELLLKHQHIHINRLTLFMYQCIGYMTSLGIPRSGDLARIYLLNKKNKAPLIPVTTTVVLERISDILMLWILLLFGLIIDLLKPRPILIHLFEEIWKSKSILFISIGMSILMLLFFVIKKYATHTIQTIKQEWKRNWPFPYIRSFLFYSLCIWIGYFLLTYIWIYALGTSHSIQWSEAFLIMLSGSLARSIPAQAGSAGIYHISVMYVITYIGFNANEAFRLAFIIHGFQTLFSLFSGLIAYIWLLIQRPSVIQ